MSKITNYIFIVILLNTFGVSHSSYAQLPKDNLVAYYPLDVNGLDASGNGNDAINTNVVSTTDRFDTPDGAMEFNGIDAYLEIDNDFDYPERTINLWFYVDDIEVHGAIYDTDNPQLQYGQTKVFVTRSDGRDTLEATVGVPHQKREIERKQWYMVTLIRTSVGTTTLLNCGEVQTRLNSNNTSDEGVEGTRLGATRFLDRFFDGKIDEVRIYDRALEEDELRALYDEGNPNLKSNAPSICPTDEAVMTPTCANACVVCDIDGFTGRNVAEDFGELPPGFAGECTVLQHKAAWIAFIAGSTNLKISMSVVNCSGGRGLELGIYAGSECGDFRRISNCHGGATGSTITEGQPRELEVFEPLIIGQYYYIVMDATPGTSGGTFETCDWTLEVLEGSTEIIPLNTSGIIIGEQQICPNLETTYYTQIDTGATEFIWTIDGVSQQINNDSIELNFLEVGSYRLCVQASNVCQAPDPTCTVIIVQDIPVTMIDTMVCESDCVMIADTMICDPGVYTRRYTTDIGCDSLIRINYMDIPTPIINVDLNICEGDTFYIGDQAYFDTGLYQERLSTVDRCDSIVNLDLFVVECNIESTSLARSVSCAGGVDGMITFQVDQGTAPFTYIWERIGGSENGSGNLAAARTEALISDLLPGQYAVTINDNFGNTDIILDEILDPEPLLFSIIVSDYNGQNISCSGADDGSLKAMISGGQGPYDLMWSNGESTDSVTNLAPDLYAVTISDDLGCSVNGSMVVTEPMPLVMMVSPMDPDCDGPNSGNIAIDDIIGGTSPYMYSINSASWQDSPVFDGLGSGEYMLYAKDENECVTSEAIMLTAPEIPIIDIGPDEAITLGDSTQLRLLTNSLTAPTITWTPDVFLSCTDCEDPYVRAANSLEYVVEVQSVDGCIDRDTIYILVDKFRRFFAASAFSPNADGVNDVFYLQGGPEVAGIVQFSVYDRWGNQVFNQRNIPASLPQVGWDGRFGDRYLNAGTFVWVAEILFIDGETINYSGDFVLLR